MKVYLENKIRLNLKTIRKKIMSNNPRTNRNVALTLPGKKKNTFYFIEVPLEMKVACTNTNVTFHYIPIHLKCKELCFDE